MIKLGTPVVANSFSGKIIGVIIKFSDSLSSYKIEWSDGQIGWYTKNEAEVYAKEAIKEVTRK